MSEVLDWTEDDARSTPVNGDRCLWCKCSPVENPTRLASGEILCGACLGDLREWKRTRYVDLLVSSSLQPSTRAALLEEWSAVQDTLVEIQAGGQGVKALP